MKKLLILIILFLFSSLANGLEFDVSFSIRSAKQEGIINDFQFASGINFPDRFNAEIEIEREDGKHYLNYETEAMQKWSYLVVSTKRTYIQCRGIDQIYLEVLGRYMIEQKQWKFLIIQLISNGWWNCGIRQEWNKGLPSTNIVIGKSFKKEIRFFLMPASIEYKTEFVSSDFKKWTDESSAKISFSFLANLDYYLKYIVKEDWFQMKTGISLKL